MMNSKVTKDSLSTLRLGCSAAAMLLFSLGTEAGAVTLPGVSAPAGAALQSAGGAVTAVGQGHAGIAPTVYGTAPALEPATDGVTSALLAVGSGLKASGQNVSTGGLTITPVAGARTIVQTVQKGGLVQVRAGQLAVGSGSSTTIVGVGVASSAPPQGTLATAGVANANDLLKANVAPQ